jgi:hypothetical protein
LTCTDSKRLADLGVAETAGAEHEHRGGFGRHPGERLAHPAAVFIDLDLLLRVDGLVALLGGLRDLAPLTAASTA